MNRPAPDYVRLLALCALFALAPHGAEAHVAPSRAVFTVQAYASPGGWSYDDPTRGVYGEALDWNITALIQAVAPGATRVTLRFSARPFKGAQISARLLGPDFRGGADYVVTKGPLKGLGFWLCHHLLDYFLVPPRLIYAGARS